MKKVLIYVFLAVIGTFQLTDSIGQNAYYDVQTIKSLLARESDFSDNKAFKLIPEGPNETLELAKILAFYVDINTNEDKEFNTLKESIQNLNELKEKYNDIIKQINEFTDSLKFEEERDVKDENRIDSLKNSISNTEQEKKNCDAQIKDESKKTSNAANHFYSRVIVAFGTNPFIEFGGYAQSTDKTSPDKHTFVTSALNNLSSLDVTTFAQGLSQFMIERAKAELNAAFFERFKKFANDNNEIGYLFPVTTKRLSNLLSFQYTEMISQLRDAFYEDLKNLPDNMITFLIKGDEFEYLRQNNPDFIIAVECLKLVRELNYLSPPEFIVQLPRIVTEEARSAAKTDTVKLEKLTSLKGTLQLASIFSESVRSISINRNWISSTEFKKNILDDPAAFQIYLGLVYQQIKIDKVWIGKDSLAAEIVNNKDEILWYRNQISELVYLANKVDYSYAEIKTLAKGDKKAGKEQLYGYINTTIEVAGFGNRFVEKYAKDKGNNKFNDYLSITQNANDIYRYIYQEEYGSAITATADLLDKLYEHDLINAGKIKNIYRVNSHLLEDKYKKNLAIKKSDLIEIIEHKPFSNRNNVRNVVFDGLNARENDGRKILNVDSVYIELQKAMIMSGEKTNNWVADFRKYGTFMANMVEAESSEEVANIIEAAALPVGSSSIKKNSKFNVAINGYLGASYRINSENVNSSNAWNSKWAVSAPVGLTMSWGLCKKSGSISLMGVILDIGAIVDYQLTSESDAKIESKITFGNIFSPGGYLVYGVPFNLPVSLGIGGQYGPGLSSVSAKDNTTVVNQPNWRWGAFLAVDIPMFNLFNVTK